MKPFQIGLLVLVGALGGGLIMWFALRAKPAPAPLVTVAATPATPAAAPPVTPPAVPAAAAAPKPAAFPEKTAPAPTPMVVRMGHHTQPMQRAIPDGPLPDGRGSEPTPPEAPAAAPPPVAVQEPAAPPISAATPAPMEAPAPAPPDEPAQPPTPPQAPSVTLPAGTTFPVRLGESLSSEHNQAGDTFTATLDAPVVAGGFVIAEKGARVEGQVVEAQKSGHGKKATLTLQLTKLDTSDGQHVAIKTEAFQKQGTSTATGDQVGIVAAAAGVGAIIGAIAGGGKGAAIGAGAGGAAGGGGVVATRDKAISLPTETKVSFRLSAPVSITERVNR